MKKILDFLEELKQHNQKEWFDAARPRYKQVEAQFNDFVQDLIMSIAEFDPEVAGLSVKDCTYRIYRDTRFSPDKTPYKTHMGAYICRGGKKSGLAGYYFHIEPASSDYLGGSLWASGLHCPTPEVLRSVREEIQISGRQFVDALAYAKGFSFDEHMKLQRPPKGFDAQSPWIEYIKLKEFSLLKPFDNRLLTDRQALLSRSVEEFKLVKPLNDILNKAVEFARGL